MHFFFGILIGEIRHDPKFEYNYVLKKYFLRKLTNDNGFVSSKHIEVIFIIFYFITAITAIYPWINQNYTYIGFFTWKGNVLYQKIKYQT